jgi:hypothetical protein
VRCCATPPISPELREAIARILRSSLEDRQRQANHSAAPSPAAERRRAAEAAEPRQRRIRKLEAELDRLKAEEAVTPTLD